MIRSFTSRLPAMLAMGLAWGHVRRGMNDGIAGVAQDVLEVQ